uniref:MEIS N-terminal domain-containing protein n=1 Tax=Plectus sambesii TaxID=2011161 RepID=A0A914UM09_9BILA
MAQTSADSFCLPDSTVSTSNSSSASDTVHEGEALYDSEARSLLLQQALIQAAAVRAQQQAVKASANICYSAEEERQKVAIQSHPLFPVLEALLLKCEDATWNMSDKSMDLDDVVQVCSSSLLSVSSVNGHKQTECPASRPFPPVLVKITVDLRVMRKFL